MFPVGFLQPALVSYVPWGPPVSSECSVPPRDPRPVRMVADRVSVSGRCLKVSSRDSADPYGSTWFGTIRILSGCYRTIAMECFMRWFRLPVLSCYVWFKKNRAGLER